MKRRGRFYKGFPSFVTFGAAARWFIEALFNLARRNPRGGPMQSSSPLRGLVVFLLEDDPLIGIDVAISLEEAGATVDGPYRNETEALGALDAGSQRLDLGVLDVHLGDHTCERVADRLKALAVPFVLHTGNREGMGSEVTAFGAPVIEKPAQGQTLVAAVFRCKGV